MARARLAGSPLLKIAGADENAVHAQLHHQRGVGRSGHAAGGEVDNGQAAQLRCFPYQVEWRANFLRVAEELVFIHAGQATDLATDRARMAHRLDDVAGAGLALGAHHGGAFHQCGGRASPRLRQPQTKGTLNLSLLM